MSVVAMVALFKLTTEVQKLECTEDNFRNRVLGLIITSSSTDNISPVNQAATADVVNNRRI